MGEAEAIIYAAIIAVVGGLATTWLAHHLQRTRGAPDLRRPPASDPDPKAKGTGGHLRLMTRVGWIGWSVATVSGVAIGVVWGQHDFRMAFGIEIWTTALFRLCIITGILQWLVLRTYSRESGWWLLGGPLTLLVPERIGPLANAMLVAGMQPRGSPFASPLFIIWVLVQLAIYPLLARLLPPREHSPPAPRPTAE